ADTTMPGPGVRSGPGIVVSAGSGRVSDRSDREHDLPPHRPLLTPPVRDVAATVGLLAGDDAEALTGQVLPVDGGSLLR
ncbi:hypothetical protein AB0I51_38740, partial [Streptomyces sp. NPDC050549]